MEYLTKDKENDSINNSKFIHIKDYSQNDLITLINRERTFFDNIDINELKLINNKFFEIISESVINNLTKEGIEKLTQAKKIQYFNNNLLNNINKEVLPLLSNEFFKQISIKQINTAKNKIITDLVKIRKIDHFNKNVLKYFYQAYFNNFKEEKDIAYLLSKAGKNFEYLTVDNFIHLDRFIGEYKKLDYFLEKLRKFRFSDEDNDIKTSYHNGILNYNDILNGNEQIIIHDEIKYRIENFLSDGDSYGLLKDYCIKCCNKDQDREIMIQTLKDILNNPTYNIYEKIEHFQILEILIFVDKIKENQIKYYISLLKMIHEINNIELYEPSEFDIKLHLFSEIVNKALLKDDLLEIIAEENLRNMKYLLNTFYTGTDKTAIPENLRRFHVQIINDYLGVLKRKYKIQDDILLKKLQNIVEDKENIDLKLNIFLKSISKTEKLYFDLMVQSIVEMPTFENKVESKANTLFKFLRDIGITILGAKCASLTGSKALTAISLGFGVAKILKNIKEEVLKSYFSLPDNQRRLYLINQRASPQNTCEVIKKKIKEKFRNVIKPTTKFVNNLIRKKILKINESKIGFDKLDFNFKDKENLKIECKIYRENDIENYFENLKSMLEPQYNQNLYQIKDKLKNQYSKKKSEKLKKFFNVKQKMINYLIKQKKDKLKKEYPEFDSTLKNNIKSFFNSVKSFGVGTINGFLGVVSFNILDIRIKDSKAQTIEKLIKGVKETEYKSKLKEFQKYEMECSISTLKDDIEFLVKSTGDEQIFKLLVTKKETDEKYFELLKKKFKTDVQEKSDLINENLNNSKTFKTIINDEVIDDFDDKSEHLIKLK